jgi:hypothetical protein
MTATDWNSIDGLARYRQFLRLRPRIRPAEVDMPNLHRSCIKCGRSRSHDVCTTRKVAR